MTNRTTLDAINYAAHAITRQIGECRVTDEASTAVYVGLLADRKTVNERAKAHGFVRIFDGSFKLTPAHIAADDAARA